MLKRLGLDEHPVRDAHTRQPVHLLDDPDKVPVALRNVFGSHLRDYKQEAKRSDRALEGYARERFFFACGASALQTLLCNYGWTAASPTEHTFRRGTVFATLSKHPALTIVAGEGEGAHDGVVPGWFGPSSRLDTRS